ncbi:unnamed protein product [marine sediment metagenome]|uniref:Uncharacterized protein n=1 Tax=marine sediment metagenome TaxID=412755 RepID=X1CP43_9ZZZZ
MWQYEIYIKGKPETLKVIEMPDQALIDRYGEATKPLPMFMRDYACKTGVFPWSDYTSLVARNYRKAEVK